MLTLAGFIVHGGDLFAMPRNEWDLETLGERPSGIERLRRVYTGSDEQWAGVASPAR